jgi:serine-type D-Ala-D-Ala carboxypeptidase/endopeptidase (penicillin-binding protein 4)
LTTLPIPATFYGYVKRPPAAKLAILLCGLLLSTLAAPSMASAQQALAQLQSDFNHQLALAGPADGAYVYDLTAKQALFSERAEVLRPPASVEKLYTATTALNLMGPTARLATTVLGVGHMAPGGVWEGSLYLRGGGDPTFGSTAFIHSHYGGIGASVSALVSGLVRTDHIHRITGAIYGDESYFDSLRGEPSSDYAWDPFLEGTLSALAFNRGEQGSERGPHAPAAFAARRLWAALRADGVSIAGPSGAATTPAGAVQLAQAPSPTIAQLLGLMLPPSDNFFAEMLVKDLGARYGGTSPGTYPEGHTPGPGTTAAGAAVVTKTLASLLGIHPHVVDGSGLSEADKTSPYQVADLLVELAPTPIGQVLRQSMAVAGRSGTLELRMRGTRAAGNCQGKTGTLTGVSNLVGYCQAADGHTLAFAIFTDGIPTETAHVFQDNMAITVADY